MATGNRLHEDEKLASGKSIHREFGRDGSLVREKQCYGFLEIAIASTFKDGIKIEEMYFVKRRLVSRRSYEKARIAYTDMPPPDNAIEDLGHLLIQGVRKQQRQNKADTEQRLAESSESRFPRPASTNWLRVIAGEKSHLVVFASRDWKALARERTIRTGRDWLRSFGFSGPRDGTFTVAKGPQVGFEVTGNREAMLNSSRLLLTDVIAFAMNPPEITRWSSSIRPRPKPRKPPALAWPVVLPPLIEFLSGLQEETVKIFNHHQ